MADWAPTAADIEALAGAGSWSIDVATGKTTWSPNHYALHGVESGSIRTIDDWAQLVHPDDRDGWRAACDRVFEGWHFPVVEHRILRPDGAVRWLQCRGRVESGADGSPESVVGVSLDVTQHRLAGESLLTFIADAAHELRTPVDAIGLAASALEVAAEADRPTVVEVLARQAARLRALTNDLIDLARLDTGGAGQSVSLAPEPVDLAAAVHESVEHAPPPLGRSVDVGVPEDLLVLATPVHLDRVLVNLLTNAYRYGGPHIEVRAERAGERVRLEVADDGDGVPAHLADTIFEPFRRGSTEHSGSSGLGLAIVARIVRRFGGSVSYRPGDPGAVFVVDLPVVR